MTKKTINVGTSPNDRTGDSLRSAFTKINDNFSELYTALGLDDVPLNLGAFEFNGNVLSTTDSTAITIDQAVTVSSNLTVGGDILPQTNLGGSLGNPSYKFHSIYVGTGSVYLGDAKISLENGRLKSSVGFDLTGSVGVVGGTVSYDDVTDRPTIPTNTNQLTNGAGFITSTSQLVNGAKTVSLANTGIVTLPLTASNASFFEVGTNNEFQIGFGTGGLLTLNKDGLVSGSDFSIDSGNNVWSFGTNGILTVPAVSGENLFIQGPEIGSLNSTIAVTSANGIQLTTDALGTAKFWQFGVDGNLSFPNNSKILSSSSESFSIYADPNAETFIGMVSQTGNEQVTLGTSGGLWEFRGDGTMYIPGDIANSDDISIRINLTDSTQRVWRFGEDGNLTLPAGGIITNSNGIDILNGLGTGDVRFAGNVISSDIDTSLFIGTTTTATDHNLITLGQKSIDLAVSNYTSNNLARVKIDNSTDHPFAQIVVNTVSSSKIWTFDDTGKLSFPDGAKYAGKTITMPNTTTGVTNSFVWEFSDNVIGSDTITLNWNLLASDTGSFYIGTTHNTNGKYLIIDGNDQSLSYIAGGMPTNGKLIFGESTNGGVGGVNDIELKSSNGDVRIATDNNRWNFTEDGLFLLGENVGAIHANQTTGIVSIGDALAPDGSGVMPSTVIAIGGSDNAFTISRGQSMGPGGINPFWKFDKAGHTTIPGDIKSDGNINIEINTGDSTLQRWSFGEDGDTVFPSGLLVSTGSANRTTLSRSSTNSLTGSTVSIAPTFTQLSTSNADAALGATSGSTIKAQIYNTLLSYSQGLESSTLTLVQNNATINVANIGTSTSRSWTFSVDGSLTFPDSSLQTTAYPGTLAAAKLPYYADTTARDAAITSPANGMACIVGSNLYFYGNSQWLQLAGTP